jgi:hypothetical protein
MEPNLPRMLRIVETKPPIRLAAAHRQAHASHDMARPFLTAIFLKAALLTSAPAELADKSELHTGKEYTDAFAMPKDDPALPNVLLIGEDRIRLVEGGETEREETDHSHARVKPDAGAQDAPLLPCQTGGGVVADKACRAVHFPHDVVAGIDAGRAADAFHLQAVADVDACGAGLDAAVATDAGARVGVGGLAARFAAIFIVSDDDRYLIRQRGLDAAVSVEDDAELLAEPCEAEPEDGGECGHDGEGGSVLERAFPHELIQAGNDTK